MKEGAPAVGPSVSGRPFRPKPNRSPKAVLAEGLPLGRLTRRFCDAPLPWPPGQAVERRSDMARHDEFENLPSFRAVR